MLLPGVDLSRQGGLQWLAARRFVTQSTDAAPGMWQAFSMTTPANPEILSAERLSEGILVTFGDGACALYSAALLYATLPSAQPIDEREQLPID